MAAPLRGRAPVVETGFPAADSRDDFARVRRNAVFARLAARLRMREGDVDVLLPFDEVVGALGHRDEQQLGLQRVDLDNRSPDRTGAAYGHRAISRCRCTS